MQEKVTGLCSCASARGCIVETVVGFRQLGFVTDASAGAGDTRRCLLRRWRTMAGPRTRAGFRAAPVNGPPAHVQTCCLLCLVAQTGYVEGFLCHMSRGGKRWLLSTGRDKHVVQLLGLGATLCWSDAGMSTQRPIHHRDDGRRGARLGQWSLAAPTKAEAKSVKPMASGAMFPWPGFATAVA